MKEGARPPPPTHDNQLPPGKQGCSGLLTVYISQETLNDDRRTSSGNLGGRPKTSGKKESLVLRLRQEGESYRSIKEQTGLALATITRIIKEQEVVA